MKRTACFALVLALAACSKKKEHSSSSSSDDVSKPAPDKAGGGGPFAAWDMAGRQAAFQGAWVTPGDGLGSWQAWNVTGGKVTIWDGTADKTLEFKLISPCEAKTTLEHDGAKESTIHHYTLLDGKIAAGLGDAGSKKGDDAIACISNKIFTLEKGKCTEWSASMFDDGKYEQKPGTCSFKGDTFTAIDEGHETVLKVMGDALLSEQLAQTHSEKVADYAAAKAARDAKK